MGPEEYRLPRRGARRRCQRAEHQALLHERLGPGRLFLHQEHWPLDTWSLMVRLQRAVLPARQRAQPPALHPAHTTRSSRAATSSSRHSPETVSIFLSSASCLWALGSRLLSFRPHCLDYLMSNASRDDTCLPAPGSVHTDDRLL